MTPDQRREATRVTLGLLGLVLLGAAVTFPFAYAYAFIRSRRNP